MARSRWTRRRSCRPPSSGAIGPRATALRRTGRRPSPPRRLSRSAVAAWRTNGRRPGPDSEHPRPRHRSGFSRMIGRMNAKLCPNATRACLNVLATISTSPRGTARGPATAAAPSPPTSAVLPAPRAIDSPTVRRFAASSPAIQSVSQGNSRSGPPAPSPRVTSRVSSHRITESGRFTVRLLPAFSSRLRARYARKYSARLRLGCADCVGTQPVYPAWNMRDMPGCKVARLRVDGSTPTQLYLPPPPRAPAGVPAGVTGARDRIAPCHRRSRRTGKNSSRSPIRRVGWMTSSSTLGPSTQSECQSARLTRCTPR